MLLYFCLKEIGLSLKIKYYLVDFAKSNKNVQHNIAVYKKYNFSLNWFEHNYLNPNGFLLSSNGLMKMH